MSNQQNPNLEILELAVGQLGELSDALVFLGGCATGLLITDTAAPPVRATRDVDTIVQVGTKADYYQFSDKLRAKGFTEDTSHGAPICRWISGSIILDVMPADPKILGFGNEWYEQASRNALTFELGSGRTIQMISAPYFIITKLLAFEGRGGGDFMMSHDIEDIVALIDGRSGLIEELDASDKNLKIALSTRFKKLLNNTRFTDAVPGHMPPDESSPVRLPRILEIMQQISELTA